MGAIFFINHLKNSSLLLKIVRLQDILANYSEDIIKINSLIFIIIAISVKF